MVALSRRFEYRGARQNINMIKEKMSKDEYDEGYALYSNCMKNTLYNCTKKIDDF